MDLLKTTKGKLIAALVFYVPFLCAVFFRLFEGKTYDSPIGGCCMPMEGVVAAGYILFTVWVVVPSLLVYAVYRLYKKTAHIPKV